MVTIYLYYCYIVTLKWDVAVSINLSDWLVLPARPNVKVITELKVLDTLG